MEASAKNWRQRLHSLVPPPNTWLNQQSPCGAEIVAWAIGVAIMALLFSRACGRG